MALVQYRPMIFQYSKIPQYHWLSKVKQQFIADWQQVFYNPLLASSATKHTAQWQKTTMEMTTEITTETKMETTMTMSLPDQDPMVRSLIPLWTLGHTKVLRRDIRWWRQWHCGCRVIYIYTLEHINPINAIVNMRHKLQYVKIGILELRCWKMKKKVDLIRE